MTPSADPRVDITIVSVCCVFVFIVAASMEHAGSSAPDRARLVDALEVNVDDRHAVSLQLHGTPRSHFTRIVRILCHELGLEVELVDVGNVGISQAFGGNPLMQVPVLVDGERTVWESHNICRYLVEREGSDPLGVESLDWEGRNLVSVIYGVMSAEVRVVLAERCGMDATTGVFAKARETLRTGLAWIDERIEDEDGLTYPAVCATAMWDHLLLFRNVQRGAAPRVERMAERLGEYASVVRTRPPE